MPKKPEVQTEKKYTAEAKWLQGLYTFFNSRLGKSTFSFKEIEELRKIFAKIPKPLELANIKNVLPTKESIIKRWDTLQLTIDDNNPDPGDAIRLSLGPDRVLASADKDGKRYVKAVVVASESILEKLEKSPDVQSELGDLVKKLVRGTIKTYKQFLSGKSPLVSVPPVDIALATMPYDDVRSTDHTGISKEQFPDIHYLGLDNQLISEYRSENMVNIWTIEFIRFDVPLSTAKDFLALFSEEEVIKYFNFICSRFVAVSLSMRPKDKNFWFFLREYIKAGQSSLSFPETFSDQISKSIIVDGYGTPISILVYLFTPANLTPGEKINYYNNLKQEMKLEDEEILWIMSHNYFSLDDFKNWLEQFGDVFSANDILVILKNDQVLRENKIDIWVLYALAKKLPSFMRSADVVVKISTDKRFEGKLTDQVINEIEILFGQEEMFEFGLIDWYLVDPTAGALTFEFCRKIGVTIAWEVAAMHKWLERTKIPKEYIESMVDLLNLNYEIEDFNSRRAFLEDVYKANLSPEQILSAKMLWNREEGVPLHIVGVSKFKTFLEKISGDEAKLQLLNYLKTKYNTIASEVVEAVALGAQKEIFDFLESEGFGTSSSWYKILLKWENFAEEWLILSPGEKKEIRELGIEEVLKMKKDYPNISVKELSMYVEQENLPDIEEEPSGLIEQRKIKKVNEFDEYKEILGRSGHHINAFAILSLLKIKPEYVKSKSFYKNAHTIIDGNTLDHIISCAYLDDELDEKYKKLIEKFNISRFSIYSLEILEGMASMYQETPNRKTAIIFKAKTDYSNATDTISEYLTPIMPTYNVFVFEVGNRKQIPSGMKEIYNWLQKNDTSKKIDLVVFDGHGDQTGITLGYPYNLLSAELVSSKVPLLAPYRKTLATDAQCLVFSCSAAKENPGDKKIFAYTIAETWPGVEVLAVNDITGVNAIVIDDKRYRVVSLILHSPDHLTKILF